MKIKLVVATRETEDYFYTHTATGRSINFNQPSFLSIRLFPENKFGLSKVYNQAIKECDNQPCIVCFAHDDLHFLDFFWFFRVVESLEHFDVVGVAGNKRRAPNQPSWAFLDENFLWDKSENLSGVVGHGKSFPPNLDVFGLPRQKVILLDGLFLAAKSQTLLDHNLFFDERFNFHFYDLDFCRQIEVKGLRCGTVDLSLIHESGGAFETKDWKDSYQSYLEKWGE
jgi:GT2 family glycosyltransferase